MKFTPRPYQRLMIDFMHTHRRCNLHAGMGVGKTASVLTYLVESGLDLTERILILGPLRVARDVWPEETRKWDHLRHLRIVPIIGTLRERHAALQQEGVIWSMNYENLEWLVDAMAHKWPFSVVVCDESTRIKSYRTRQGGARAAALARVAHTRTKYWVNLTGTPAPNGLKDLWGQQWFVDGGVALGRSYSAFMNRWFMKAPAAGQFAPMIPQVFAQRQIEALLKPTTMSVNAADWFDLTAPVVADVWVDLPDAAHRQYKTMERRFFTELSDSVRVAPTSAVKSNCCLQLANGALYRKDHSWDWVHDEKIDALRSIVEEAAGESILCAYSFQSDLARLQEAFPKARVLASSDRTVVDDWNAGRVPLLLAHPKSAGHGLNLAAGGHILVYFGQDWNLEDFEQIAERIGPTRQAQLGRKTVVFHYHILARGTLDAAVKMRREGKLTVQQALMAAMKGGGDGYGGLVVDNVHGSGYGDRVRTGVA